MITQPIKAFICESYFEINLPNYLHSFSRSTFTAFCFYFLIIESLPYHVLLHHLTSATGKEIRKDLLRRCTCSISQRQSSECLITTKMECLQFSHRIILYFFSASPTHTAVTQSHIFHFSLSLYIIISHVTLTKQRKMRQKQKTVATAELQFD